MRLPDLSDETGYILIASLEKMFILRFKFQEEAMDPINILVALNLFATIGANFSGAKRGLKTSLIEVREKPKTFLQNWPPNIAAVILVLIICSIFGLGVADYKKVDHFFSFRMTGFTIFLIFSWFQVWSYKTLGKNYSQDIVILKNHELVVKGPYKFIRHPQYLGQILSDLGASIALLSYLSLPLVLFLEIPLLIMRAQEEEKLLEKYFKNTYLSYKKKTGGFIPFIG